MKVVLVSLHSSFATKCTSLNLSKCHYNKNKNNYYKSLFCGFD